MKQTTLIALAAALVAIADELRGETGASTPEADTTEAPKRGRGRPAAPAETPTGPTDAERFEANRSLIKPLVEGGQGEEVKKVIGKYSKTGLKDIPADKQADFAKDIEALSY